MVSPLTPSLNCTSRSATSQTFRFKQLPSFVILLDWLITFIDPDLDASVFWDLKLRHQTCTTVLSKRDFFLTSSLMSQINLIRITDTEVGLWYDKTSIVDMHTHINVAQNNILHQHCFKSHHVSGCLPHVVDTRQVHVQRSFAGLGTSERTWGGVDCWTCCPRQRCAVPAFCFVCFFLLYVSSWPPSATHMYHHLFFRPAP